MKENAKLLEWKDQQKIKMEKLEGIEHLILTVVLRTAYGHMYTPPYHTREREEIRRDEGDRLRESRDGA